MSKFSCLITNNLGPDTIIISKSVNSELANIQGDMRLNVKDFNCQNPMMTGDLRKTLKASEFPYLKILFISFSHYPDRKSKSYPINGIVSIELAGVSKRFNVAYTVLPSGTNSLILKGIREIKFSDFNLIPPRKIGGVIQTSDKLIAEFNLALHLLND